MTSRLIILAALSVAAAAAAPACAQTLKPGLWEVQNKVQAGDSQLSKAMAEMQKQLASMPPAQRKAMEDMMAKHGGMNMPTMKDGGMTMKICMTPEMGAQNQVPMQQDGNCKHTRSPVVGGTMKVSFSCTDPVSHGEGVVRLKGDTGYDMSMNLSMPSTVSGKQETTTMTTSGTFLAANCGNIKPPMMPPAAKK